MEAVQKLEKYLPVSTIKQQTGTGFRKFQKAIWTDGEKFYVLHSSAYKSVIINDKEYVEVEQTLGNWYMK